MRTNEHKGYRIRRIRSLQDLREEKTRLRFEILKSEEQVRGNYRHLKDALTFRNILANIQTVSCAQCNAV